MKKILSILTFIFFINTSSFAEENFSVLLCERPETLGQVSRNMLLQIDLKDKTVFDGYNSLEIDKVDPFFIQAISYEREYTIDRFLGRLVEYRYKSNGSKDMKSKIEWKCDKIERMF
jgi:hypothetical protein